jgi:hypothetical protein
MADPGLIERGNEAFGRLQELDRTAVTNARAFRALLENLHGRDLSVVQEPHVGAIRLVRAGILRGAIGTVMACLDPADRCGNRASIGQILEILEEPNVADVFSYRWRSPGSGATTLQEARHDYDALLASDLFDRGRRLRNEAIAHLLVPGTPTPTVDYAAIYQLDDAAEQLMTKLSKVVGLGAPEFIEQCPRLTESAKTFWDTYFRGMKSPPG